VFVRSFSEMNSTRSWPPAWPCRLAEKIREYGIDMPCTARVEMRFGCNTLSGAFGAFFQDGKGTLAPIPTSTTHRIRTLNDTNTLLDRFFKLWGMHV
jgi:hypothetical protein